MPNPKPASGKTPAVKTRKAPGAAGSAAALAAIASRAAPSAPAAATPPTPAARQARRGHGRVTLQDVAVAAGVTAITVSRYLRAPAVVAEDTAARIRAALSHTGYVPNKQAGLLASGAGSIVAALLPNLANSIFAETAQGLSDGLQAAGYELLIASTGYSQQREEHQLRAMLGWQPAAVVVTGRRHAPGALQLLANAKAAGTPVIEIWDHHPPERGARRTTFTQIGFNHDAVGRAMAEHLLQAGHRQLAYVDSGVAEDYRAHERGVAFAQAARAAGATVSVMVAPAGDAFDAGRHVLGQLVQSEQSERSLQSAHSLQSLHPAQSLQSVRSAHSAHPTPAGALPITAAAFANDHLACGALLEAAQRGVAVPQRLALLGFGDFAIARQLSPALSSVQLPRHAIGAETARSLLEALRHGKAAVPVSLPWALVARGSTLRSC